MHFLSNRKRRQLTHAQQQMDDRRNAEPPRTTFFEKNDVVYCFNAFSGMKELYHVEPDWPSVTQRIKNKCDVSEIDHVNTNEAIAEAEGYTMAYARMFGDEPMTFKTHEARVTAYRVDLFNRTCPHDTQFNANCIKSTGLEELSSQGSEYSLPSSIGEKLFVAICALGYIAYRLSCARVVNNTMANLYHTVQDRCMQLFSTQNNVQDLNVGDAAQAADEVNHADSPSPRMM